MKSRARQLENKAYRFHVKKGENLPFDVKWFSCSKYRSNCLSCQLCDLRTCKEYADHKPELHRSRSVRALFELHFGFLFDEEEVINSIPRSYIADFVRKVVFATNLSIYSGAEMLRDRVGASNETLRKYIRSESRERNSELKDLLQWVNGLYYIE